MSTDSSKAFVPKQFTPITLDKTTVYVYPMLSSTMNENKKTYGFGVTKNALKAASMISFKTRLECLKQTTNSASTVDVISSKFIDHAEDFISKISNLSIKSYHGPNGHVIFNCTITQNGHLKPTSNVTAPNRRPANICFAKVSTSIDFSSINLSHVTKYPFTFYVDLNITTEDVPTSTGGLVELRTFHGEDDWAHDTQEKFETVTKANTAIGKPFDLKPPSITDDINLEAVINVGVSSNRLEEIALKASWNTITDTVYHKICPTAISDPCSALQNIHQSITNPNTGERESMSLQDYYSSIKQYTDFLSKKGDWPMDVVQHFLSHLNEGLHQQTMKDFNYNPVTAKKDAYLQSSNLLEALCHATTAEEQKTSLKNTITQHMQGNQTMMANVNMSIAEKVISEYTKAPVSKTIEKVCWGCGSKDHVYTIKNTVVCPNKDMPGVQEKAAKVRIDFNERRCAIQKKCKANNNKDKKDEKRVATIADIRAMLAEQSSPTRSSNFVLSTSLVKSNDAQTSTSDSSEFSFQTSKVSASPSSIINPVDTDLASSINSLSIMEKTKKPSSSCNTVSVLSSNGIKPPLPINFDSNLPHINFDIGKSNKKSFKINIAYDTCAALNVGYAGYHLTIAKQFPSVVKSLTWAKQDYSPLVLSGIVKDGENSSTPSSLNTTTTLLAIIEYYTPYSTKEGSPVTLKIALGNNVGVNTIMGLSTIKNACLSLDLDANIFQAGILNEGTFEVLFKPTSRSIPDTSPLKAHPCFKELKDESDFKSIVITECYNSTFKETINVNMTDTQEDKDESNNKTWMEDQNATNGIQPSPIKCPKKTYHKKLASKWVESLSEERSDPNFEPINKTITNLSTSLRKNIKEFNNPTTNPNFTYRFDKQKDEATLNKQLKLEDHLSDDTKNRVRSLVIEFYDVFREEGLSVPIRGYEMVIDTGNHRPICIPQPHYGLHESPIMQKSIDSLLKLRFIKADLTSPWGFRITLAPKPHQEDITNINDFVWRFCINYIHLNRITRPASYPIPRCDDAVMYRFGTATYFILMDAHSGYHQVALSPESMLKTAFFAPHGRKYVYVVMPFGLRNAPAIFVAMMHDLKSLWTKLCEAEGIVPSENEGTTIIIDDIFAFAVLEDNAFIILKCIACISRKYHLTMKLKKCQWFPKEVEFVGVDISIEGNSPARSKFKYLNTWKMPKSPRYIMSFIGFGMFYCRWIPYFKLLVTPLCNIIKQFKIDHIFKPGQFNDEAMKAYNTIKHKILSKPILQRANIKLRMYLKTDFSSLSLGFALCQPSNDPDSINAMNEEIAGGPCRFDTKLKGLRLRPIAFRSRRTVGNEKHFHSYPGEALCASWAIIKNRQFLWGKEFTLLTDCQALLWIMGYKGHNHAVKRLQLELIGYYFTICHRPGRMMEDANFLSRLDEDTSIDPLLRDYLSFACQIYSNNKPPSEDITHDNLPERQKKRTSANYDSAQVNFATLDFQSMHYTEIPLPDHTTNPSETLTLQNVPIIYSNTGNPQRSKSKTSYNHYCVASAATLQFNSWCFSKPKFSHWLNTAKTNAIPFICTLAIESNQSCRDSLQNVHKVPFIKPNIVEALSLIKNKSFTYQIQGFHSFLSKEMIIGRIHNLLYLNIQLINMLHLKCQLKIAVFEFHHEVPSAILFQFKSNLDNHGWKVKDDILNYSDFSDDVAGQITLLSAIHKNFLLNQEIAISTITHPPSIPISISTHILAKFNLQQHSIPNLDDLFELQIINDRHTRRPSISAIIKPKAEQETYPHEGCQIYDTSYPAPLPTSNPNGLFGQLFGIVFRDNYSNKAFCQSISTYEYISCFGFDVNFTYSICERIRSIDEIQTMTPHQTTLAIMDSCFETLSIIQKQEIQANSALLNTDLSPNVFLNGIIHHQLPNDSQWSLAYKNNTSCNLLLSMISDPSLIIPSNINKLHFIYRAGIRNSTITYKNNRLILSEPTVVTSKTIKLIIVPQDLCKHIFNAFHTNPLGGHFSLYQTLHRIQLRYKWPNLYKYIKMNIQSCVACTLKNNAAHPSSELLYTFALDAPMNTIHANLWQPGHQTGFDNDKALMIVACHMTTFVAIEPIKEMNSKAFTKAVYKIMMRYGLASLIVTDPDSKFKKEFKDMCSLLKIPHHLSSKGNHNAIIVERFNKFLNSGMRIFTSERGTNRVFLEAVEMLCYAWNSAPVTGTDLSRSLLVVGRDFRFPIDISNNRHITYNINKINFRSFANDLLSLLSKCREIYSLLIQEQRTMHREYQNSQLKNPKKFKLNNLVFTNVQIQSKSKDNQVKKLSYTRRGPYKIIKTHPSGSYDLKLTTATSSSVIKKHGSELILCPKYLIPHKPIQSSDHIYSELNKKIIENPFSRAFIEGYTPTKPWEAAAAALSQIDLSIKDLTIVPDFPSVEQLDAEYDSWPKSSNPFAPTTYFEQGDIRTTSSSSQSKEPSNNTDPIIHTKSVTPNLTSNATFHPIPIQPFPSLIQSIISSNNKLFFIAYNIPNQSRKEWKLVQLDFQQSMKRYPNCHGKFIMNFLIAHPKDSAIPFQFKQFWIEYHKILSPKRLHNQFHIIQPSDISQKLAIKQDLTPYQEG